MRFKGFALALSALVLGACAGGDNKAADSAAATTDTAVAAAPAPAPAPDATVPAGTVHEVQMVGDAQGYRFEPAALTIKAGDTVKWTMVSGGPHNVAFDGTKLGANKAMFVSLMPNQAGELMSPMFTQPNESYSMTFTGVPAGTYEYNCTPHLAMNMKGTITVQ